MTTSKKGFDPLGSLFDLPEPLPVPPSPVAPAAPPPVKGDELPESTHVKPTPPLGPDPAELAKILARAALSKAGAPKPPGGGSTLVPAPAGAPVKPAKAAKPAAPAKEASRLSSAPPPQRALSAADAMRVAQAHEARAEVERKLPPPVTAPAAPPVAADAMPSQPNREADDLVNVVSGIAGDSLPGLGDVYVARALIMDDRGVLTALWRAHRARFVSSGDVAGAVSVLAVLRALAAVGRGQLVAAHAVTDKSDWLLWVDLGNQTLVAAFKDPRAWLAGG